MAAHEGDRAMPELLRRSLRADAAAPGVCPGADILAAYYERSLGPDEAAGCEHHVSQCGRCREQLAAMARAEAPPLAEPRRAWLLDWRWLVPAVTALLILTVWGMRGPASKFAGHRSANEPLVALSRSEQSAEQTVPQPQASAPASAPASRQGAASESHPRREMAQPSPQLQSATRAVPPAAQKNSAGNLTLNDSAAESSLKMTAQQATVQADRLAEAGAAAAPEEKKTVPAGFAPVPAQPVPAAQPSTPPFSTSQSATATGEVPVFNKNYSNIVGLSTAKQSASTIPNKSGAANEKALAQSTEQKSAQIFIRTPDPMVLWRIAGAGFVERSQDGGATWNGQLPEMNAHFTAGEAPSAKALWLVGENGIILVTKDAAHWKKVPPPIPADFVSVDAQSASSATVTAASGQKFSTSNGGKKWVPAP